jgi:hypothetical protein
MGSESQIFPRQVTVKNRIALQTISYFHTSFPLCVHGNLAAQKKKTSAAGESFFILTLLDDHL